jgi:hypothetical protein
MPASTSRSCRSRADETYTPDARAADFAAAHDGVASIAQLAGCGLDRDAIKVRVDRGVLHRIHRGVYAVGHPGISRRGRFRAAVLAGKRGTALARFSAAAEWGFVDWTDLLDGAGIPRPLVNQPRKCGGRTIVPDFLWPDRRLAIEADSVTWHEHKLVRENDADKQAILEAGGYRVIRVTKAQAERRPKQTLARIRAALDATG